MTSAEPRFRLDLAAGQLVCGETAVPLRAKSWTVLCHLAERPGVLVSVRELLEAAWPHTHVTPNTLTNVIGELRRALDDDPDHPRYLETVHRRGYRFIGRLDRDSPPPVPPRRFVGRAAELERLDACWARAASGQRALAAITGPAGSGKTALVEAWAARLALHAAAPPIGWGRAIDQGDRPEPMLAVREALRSLGRESASLPGSVTLTDLADRVDALACERPLVVVLEDLGFADSLTLDGMTLLAERRVAVPLLVIVTARSGPSDAATGGFSARARSLAARGACEAIALPPLTAAETEAYLSERLGGAPPRPALELARELSLGRPLFLRALVDDWLQRGWLWASPAVERGGADEVANACSFDAASVRGHLPEVVRAALDAEIDGRDAATCEVLEAASVLGESFRAEDLARMLDTTCARVEAICERLVRSGEVLGPAWLGAAEGHSPEPGYRFTDALHPRVLSARLGAVRRRRLHRAAAVALARRPFTRSARAWHLACGGEPERAAGELERAACEAIVHDDYARAEESIERALALTRTMPASAGRATREARLELALGNARAALVGFRVSGDTYAHAAELARRAGAAIELFRGEIGAVTALLADGNVGRATAVARGLVAVSEHGLPGGAAAAHYSLGSTLAMAGRFQEAETALRRVVDMPSIPGVPVLVDAARLASWRRAVMLHHLGHFHEARLAGSEAFAAIRAHGSPIERAVAALQGVELAIATDDRARAWAIAREGLLVARAHGLASFEGSLRFVLGWTGGDLRAGSVGPANVSEMEAALEQHRARGDRWSDPGLLALLAGVHLANGAVDAAQSAVRAGLDRIEAGGARIHEVELRLLEADCLGARARTRHTRRGDVARAQGGDAGAVEHTIRRALDLAREQGSLLFEIRAASRLARLLAGRRKRAEARELLGGVIEGPSADPVVPVVRQALELVHSLH